MSDPRSFPCPLCGEPLPADANSCTKCDWVRGLRNDRPPRTRTPRDAAGALLSLVPGAGHIFKGYPLLGWVLMLVGTPAVIIMAFAFTMFLGWLMVPVYWIAVAVDAYLRKDLRAPAIGTRVI